MRSRRLSLDGANTAALKGDSCGRCLPNTGDPPVFNVAVPRIVENHILDTGDK
jgi:hypothetical protein